MIELNPIYQKITITNNRYIILTGGRGSGKSKALSVLKALYTFTQDVRVLFTRYTLTSARVSIISEFNDTIKDLEIEDCFEVTNQTIVNKHTKSEILFKGIKSSSGNQTANLKSLAGVTSWVLDEAEELTDETTFDKIDFSIRKKGVQNYVILILNPTTKDHWIWQRFFEKTHKYINIDGHNVPISTHPDVLHIHSTYLDNYKHLSESFLKGMERMKAENPEKYYHVALGGWLLRAEGCIYTNWIEGDFDNNLPYCFGMDFGMSPDPTTCVKVAVDFKEKTIYCAEMFGGLEINNDDLLTFISQARNNKYDLFVGDLSDKRLINELRRKDVEIIKCTKDPIKERIRKIKNFKIIVTDDSYNLKRELNNYVWNNKKASIPLENGNDHYINAMEYAFERLSRGQNFTI